MEKYPAFGSIPRLHKPITLTEKIDGSNGLISIEEKPFGSAVGDVPPGVTVVMGPLVEEHGLPEFEYWLRAGSRNRWLTVEADNFGFAKWVRDNVNMLVMDLPPGMHYGEWWGSGIQRGYGLTKGEKRFSLFNTKRWGTVNEGKWEPVEFMAPGLGVVPVLHWEVDAHLWNDYVNDTLEDLRVNGSKASPGFMRPEGIVIYHSASNSLFKAFVEDDDVPKSVVAQRVSTVKARGGIIQAKPKNLHGDPGVLLAPQGIIQREGEKPINYASVANPRRTQVNVAPASVATLRDLMEAVRTKNSGE